MMSNKISQISNFESNLECLTQLYNDTLNEIAPMRVIRHSDGELINTKVAALQKRRDRFLKKFKKTNNPDHLSKAKSFSKTLKKAVKKESRRIFQCKARSPNPKHFWQALNDKMGKYRDSVLEIEVDKKKISDPVQVANHFASFFLSKVVNLSIEPVTSHSLARPNIPIQFSLQEVESAFKTMSNKKSYGIDGIPQNLFKDTSELVNNQILDVLNSFCRNGLADNLRIARVSPLHKKGSKLDINNYRPISNLSVFSKIYEKCLLSRINQELPGYEGDHQHGFRKSHSTETALLTLQSILASMHDRRQQGLIYSIDLSAAFDLLRPDKFLELFKDILSEGLLYSIIDFLSNRSFQVHLQDESSELKTLDRGCVQGSILGPKLFSLYMARLRDVVVSDEISLISYADDSYVVVAPKNIDQIQDITENTLSKHIEFLRSIGMVVNESKTEIMWIGQPLSNPIDHIRIGSVCVPFSNKIKALGILIQGDLSWDAQAEQAIGKSKKLLSAFRFLRKYLSESQFLKAASANYYGAVFYASSVWFRHIKQVHKTKLTSIHFRMLRVAKRDFKTRLKRPELTQSCQRATPEQWSKFITASTVIKIMRDKTPTFLFEKLQENYFEEKRKPFVGQFFDTSRILKGQQSLQNKLLFMRSINYPWHDPEKPLSNDVTRIELKRTFYTYLKS